MKLKTLLAVSALLLPTLAMAAPQGRANRRPQQSQKALCLDIATARAHMITYNVTCKGNSREEAEQAPEVGNASSLFHNNGMMAEINRLGGRNLSNEQYCAAIKPTVDKAEAQFGDADGAK